MTWVPSSTTDPLKTGVLEVVAVTSTSLPRTHPSTSSTTDASTLSESAHLFASALLPARSMENILTSLIEGSSETTPLTCWYAMPPAPTIPIVLESFLARYLQESPETAPVLIAVRIPPERTPFGSPVSPSTRIVTALVDGTPLFLVKTLTTLTLASALARLAIDGMMRTSPDGTESLDLRGESTFPWSWRANAPAISSMQSAIGHAAITSSASSKRILKTLGLPLPS